MEVKKLRSWIKDLKDDKYCIDKLKLKQTNKQQTTNNKQQTTNNKQQTTNNKQQKKKIMNPHTLFYLLPEDVLPSILKHLNKETRTIMLCLIYYGDKIDLWNKWYPVTIKA